MSSNERKASTSGTSTPRTEGSVQGENNSATVVVGVDITDSTNASKPKSAELTRKRKSAAKFDILETKKPKDSKDADFFLRKFLINLGLKAILLSFQEEPIKHQLISKLMIGMRLIKIQL